jgi:hypothetical protein
MKQWTRVLIALGILALVALIVLGVDAWQRQRASTAEIPAGAIPLYLDGKFAGAFTPADLDGLNKTSFTDAEEGKLQQGWLLRDVIRLHVSPRNLKPDSVITITSSSRGKSATVTWTDADEPANQVMLELSNRGTLKLVSSRLPALDTRNEWVQDVDRIEVTSP